MKEKKDVLLCPECGLPISERIMFALIVDLISFMKKSKKNDFKIHWKSTMLKFILYSILFIK
jgi:hypothetical protein